MLAAGQGNQQALNARKFLLTQLSVTQIAKGERLAQEWTKKHAK